MTTSFAIPVTVLGDGVQQLYAYCIASVETQVAGKPLGRCVVTMSDGSAVVVTDVTAADLAASMLALDPTLAKGPYNTVDGRIVYFGYGGYWPVRIATDDVKPASRCFAWSTLTSVVHVDGLSAADLAAILYG